MKKGFTLSELLIVIVIVGLLTATAAISYDKVRSRGRDSKQKADISNIGMALDAYYSFKKRYPIPATGCSGKYNRASRLPCMGNGESFIEDRIDNDFKNYLNPVPVYDTNPGGADFRQEDNPCNGTDRFYQYRVDGDYGTHYFLLARLENQNDPDVFHKDTSCNKNNPEHLLPWLFDYSPSSPLNPCTGPLNKCQPDIYGYPIFILYK